MTTLNILFYIFSGLSIVGALSVITSKNPVKAVLSLVFCFVFAACTWLLLEAEYLALVLIVVYVGAVMVLFMFVVMMIDVDKESHKPGLVKHWPIALIISVAVVAMLFCVVNPAHLGLSVIPAPKPYPADYSTIKALGYLIFTKYLYAFELAAVLLLAAMIAAITLTFRGRRPGVKGMTPNQQVKVTAKDRLKIVNMPANKTGDKSK